MQECTVQSSGDPSEYMDKQNNLTPPRFVWLGRGPGTFACRPEVTTREHLLKEQAAGAIT